MKGGCCSDLDGGFGCVGPGVVGVDHVDAGIVRHQGRGYTGVMGIFGRLISGVKQRYCAV